MVSQRSILVAITAMVVGWMPSVAPAQTMGGVKLTTTGKPNTDSGKIADAMRGGPPFVTAHATVLDWPTSPGGAFRVLRAGSNGWSCLSGLPMDSHDEPGCFDPVYLKFVEDGLAGRPSSIETVGISYMYQGKFVPNKSHQTPGREFHVGPHIMVVVPHKDQAELAAISRDGSNGQAYTNQVSNDADRYLVIPIREWPRK